MTDLPDVVDSLLKKTRAGKLAWTASGDYLFTAKLADIGVSIRRERDGAGRSTYHLTLLDDEDAPIQRVTGIPGQRFATTLAGIYDAARRQALHVDARLDTFKHALDDL